MPDAVVDRIDLAGIVLPDARTGAAVDLGTMALAVISVIRHRF